MKYIFFAVLCMVASAAVVTSQQSTQPSFIIGGESGLIGCLTNQITQVEVVSAGYVRLHCGPTASTSPRHYFTLSAQSSSLVACGKNNPPSNRGVLSLTRINSHQVIAGCD